METNQNNEHFHHSKHCWMKYLMVALLTLLGSFLAFYFLTDYTIKRMLDPVYQMKRAEKMMQHQEKKMINMGKKFEYNMAKDFEMMNAPYSVMNLVHIKKGDDSYEVVVDLKPFDGNPNNINVSVSNDILTINGKIEKNKQNKTKILNFSQSYMLDEKVQADKIRKETNKDNYVITIPFED